MNKNNKQTSVMKKEYTIKEAEERAKLDEQIRKEDQEIAEEEGNSIWMFPFDNKYTTDLPF